MISDPENRCANDRTAACSESEVYEEGRNGVEPGIAYLDLEGLDERAEGECGGVCNRSLDCAMARNRRSETLGKFPDLV